MNPISDIAGKLQRRRHPDYGWGDPYNGICWVKVKGEVLSVIFSDGEWWDHVSVSTAVRCPTWAEMCAVRDLFWPDEVWVMQWHPPKAEYVDFHPYCLHLWKPHDDVVQTPPTWLVGPLTEAA